MATQDYLKLLRKARETKIKLTNESIKEIRDLYKDVYKKVCKDLEKSKPGTLNERWLQEYKKELLKEIQRINKHIEDIITDKVEKTVDAQIDVQLQFFSYISSRFNLKLEPTFSSMFSEIKTNVIKELIHGDMYKDRKGLSERIWKDTKRFEKDINTIVMEGIAQKKSTLEIAKDLEIYVSPDAKKKFDWSKIYPGTKTKVDYNAQRLARTSINHAYQQALKRSCEKNPYVEGIEWVSSLIHGRTCKLCEKRHGTIYEATKNEGRYTTEPVPIDHPNGLCTLIPVIEKDFEEIGKELRSWIDGESNLKLDLWLSKYGKDFLPKEK